MPSTYDLVVRGGTIVSGNEHRTTDLAVRNGRVAALGDGLIGQEYCDAEGLHLLPGLVDIHVHFREPGLTYKEDFASGSMAAAAGGVTTVHDMPNTVPPVATAEVFSHKVALVSRHTYVDFGLYGMLAQDNVSELANIAALGAVGFKLFMGQTTGDNPCPDDGAIFAGFREIARLGMVAGVHAENNPVLQRLKQELRNAGRTDAVAHLESRPAFVEAEAVGRALTLAEAAGNRLHIHHLSTSSALERVKGAKRAGVPVSCEVLAGHLVLDRGAYTTYGNLIQLNPPIREREHVEALWEGIVDRTVDCIATDHAPHSVEEQSRANVWDACGGFIGVETLLPLMLTQVHAGRLTLADMVRLTSETPARLYGHYPRKGCLDPGSDADFVLVDLHRRWRIDQSELHSRHRVTPYDGWEVVGKPVATYLRGRCIARNGQVTGLPSGKLLRPGSIGDRE